MTSVQLASQDTVLGQLQRGQGRGYLAARDNSDVDALMHCLRHDPRCDRDSEDRAAYYARLVVDLGVPVQDLAALFEDERPAGDKEALRLLCSVLVALWERGASEAFEPLRAALCTSHWQAVIEELLCVQDYCEDSLLDAQDVSVLMEQEGFAEGLGDSGDWQEWVPAEIRAETRTVWPSQTMNTEQLLATLDEWNRYSVEKLLLPRRDAKTYSLLRAAVLGSTPLQRGVALSVLGRQDARGLLEHCETRLASAPDEQERTDLQSYLFALRPSVTLPLAHRLLARGGLARTVACRVLAKNRAALTRDALGDLRSLFEEAVIDEAAFPDDDFCSDEIPRALGLIGDERSTHVLVAAYESTPCSFFRSSLLVALHRCNAPIAAALSTDALYDSDRSTRRWAMRHAPSTPLVEGRLRELAARPFQRGDVETLTKERLAEFAASTHE